MQAASLVTEQAVSGSVVCGRDADAHVAAVTAFRDAGYHDVYINQIGPDQEQFFSFYNDRVLPQLRDL